MAQAMRTLPQRNCKFTDLEPSENARACGQSLFDRVVAEIGAVQGERQPQSPACLASKGNAANRRIQRPTTRRVSGRWPLSVVLIGILGSGVNTDMVSRACRGERPACLGDLQRISTGPDTHANKNARCTAAGVKTRSRVEWPFSSQFPQATSLKAFFLRPLLSSRLIQAGQN